jgi:hAT family C-terminal dimerisation region
MMIEELRHLNTAGKNATYISPMSQNQLIDAMASVIKRDIVTLPVTTATGERSFSALKYLKNYLRSKMGEERLNGLAHMCINRYQSELRKSH